MVKRKIVEIDEDKCNGCGLCIPNCHEGALQIVNGKAKLVDEVYCDGLGNCLGECPQDAIQIVEKDVKDFDFEATNDHLVKTGKEELKENPLANSNKPSLPCGCPGTAIREIKPKTEAQDETSQESQLSQWPVQLHLLPPNAPFFKDSDLLVCADCVPFANADFHSRLLKGKSLVIGCPKLDDVGAYKEKIAEIIKINNLKSITVAIMEVPCCFGLYGIVKESVDELGLNIPVKKVVISVDGKPELE